MRLLITARITKSNYCDVSIKVRLGQRELPRHYDYIVGLLMHEYLGVLACTFVMSTIEKLSHYAHIRYQFLLCRMPNFNKVVYVAVLILSRGHRLIDDPSIFVNYKFQLIATRFWEFYGAFPQIGA